MVDLDLIHKKDTRQDMVHSSGLRGNVDVMQQQRIDPLPLLEKYHINLTDFTLVMCGLSISS